MRHLNRMSVELNSLHFTHCIRSFCFGVRKFYLNPGIVVCARFIRTEFHGHFNGIACFNPWLIAFRWWEDMKVFGVVSVDICQVIKSNTSACIIPKRNETKVRSSSEGLIRTRVDWSL